MKKTIEEHHELVKAGMLEKGKDPTPGFFSGLLKLTTQHVSDRTRITDHPENHNPDRYKRL